MAPEQFELDDSGKRVYNKFTDVWSYGIVVWEIFSGGYKHSSEFELLEVSAKS